MNIELINILTTFGASVVSALVGYASGKRQRENEADKTAFEAYNYAIESLRREMENRVGELQRRIEQLEEENKQLRIANFNLMQNEKR
mgnify:CR=1 FL=1